LKRDVGVGKEKSYEQGRENRCQGEYSIGTGGLHRRPLFDVCLMCVIMRAMRNVTL